MEDCVAKHTVLSLSTCSCILCLEVTVERKGQSAEAEDISSECWEPRSSLDGLA